MIDDPQPAASDGPRLDLSIVVVSYNVRELLSACLRSTRALSSRYSREVIVVDNASSDGTIELVRREFPDVRIETNSVNRGFGQAANQGASVARGEQIMFLNPDATLGVASVDPLLAVLATQPDVGIVGPKMCYPDGGSQSTRRRFPTPVVALIESTLVQRWLPNLSLLDRFYVLDRPDVRQDVDWLVGACLTTRRSVLRDVGGFDARFFMYSEELDWCRRTRAAGWRIVYVPEAEIIHHEGRSSEQHLTRRAINFNESKARYFEKYNGRDVGRALRAYLLANTLYDLVGEGLKLTLGHCRALRRRRVGQLLAIARFQAAHLNGYADEKPPAICPPRVSPTVPADAGQTAIDTP